MPTREEARQILDGGFAARKVIDMYTNVKFVKGMVLGGPFFQNVSNYDQSISRPDHRGAIRVPPKGFVDGPFFARFPFLNPVPNIPDGAVVSFSQTLYEKAKMPVAAAEPLPEPEKPILGTTGESLEGGEELPDDQISLSGMVADGEPSGDQPKPENKEKKKAKKAKG